MIGESATRSGPFAHTANTVQRTMFMVLLALTPATLFNLYLFGWPAILLFAVTVGACVVAEAACLVLAGKPVSATLSDGSAILTGWLLAMTLPPWAPWWIGVLGAMFAMPLAKHAFGGLGQNLFNPAMVARVALLVSFPVVMTAWVAPHPLFTTGSPTLNEAMTITFAGETPDGVTAATALGYVKTELSRGVPVSESLQVYGRSSVLTYAPDLMDLATGFKPGSLGETSAGLILLGGIFLLWRRVITWHIPVMMIGTLFVMGTLVDWCPGCHVRHSARQACLRRPGSESVQPGHGRAGRLAGVFSGGDDRLGRTPPLVYDRLAHAERGHDHHLRR